MGQKVAKLRPMDGFCAELGAATSLIISSFLGVPVSTTHTITGAIMGVGSLNRMSAVRWGMAGQIVWAWILTIPARRRCRPRSITSPGADPLLPQKETTRTGAKALVLSAWLAVLGVGTAIGTVQ
jgi:hypothetical protein